MTLQCATRNSEIHRQNISLIKVIVKYRVKH